LQADLIVTATGITLLAFGGASLAVDGKPVRPAAATRLFRYYKAQRVLTAANDPQGRPTIYDRLPPGLPRLMPVGRLDFMTEGLLLLTNDGEFKRQLELPSTGVVRTYRARAYGQVSQAELEDTVAALVADDRMTRKLSLASTAVSALTGTPSSTWTTPGANDSVPLLAT